MEGLSYSFLNKFCADGCVVAPMKEADDGKNNEGQNHSRTGRVDHIADVREQIGTGDCRSQVGGVGKRRHFVSEICAGYDRSGN